MNKGGVKLIGFCEILLLTISISAFSFIVSPADATLTSSPSSGKILDDSARELGFGSGIIPVRTGAPVQLDDSARELGFGYEKSPAKVPGVPPPVPGPAGASSSVSFPLYGDTGFSFGANSAGFFFDHLTTGVFYGAAVYFGIQTVGGLLGLDQPLTDALSNAGLEELLLVNH